MVDFVGLCHAVGLSNAGVRRYCRGELTEYPEARKLEAEAALPAAGLVQGSLAMPMVRSEDKQNIKAGQEAAFTCHRSGRPFRSL
jgi:hypothetical protein